ncbi:MAG: EamA family transporter [Coriobacteriia bacterium]|nr:EamA family transporter [Coriobacteriia bacterium]
MRSGLTTFDIALISVSVLIAVAGQFMLKSGMTKAVPTGAQGFGQMLSVDYVVRLITTWQVPVALALYALGAFLWMAVLSRFNVSVAMPFLATSYVIVLLIDWALGRVQPQWYTWAGTLLVSVGVVLVAMAPRR